MDALISTGSYMNIEKGLSALGIDYSQKQLDQLEMMLTLLNKWNTRHNLTRYTQKEDQIIYHVLDSLSAYPYFKPFNHILDIGTGAGFPGIPLAILYPEKTFHLVDSNGKKVAYLQMLIQALALSRVTVHHERIENIDIQSDVITARALSSTQEILKLTKDLQISDYILYVGRQAEEDKIKVNVPGSEKEHYIVCLSSVI